MVAVHIFKCSDFHCVFEYPNKLINKKEFKNVNKEPARINGNIYVNLNRDDKQSYIFRTGSVKMYLTY